MVPGEPDNEEEDHVGRIVVTEFVSLDGVIEDPGGAEDFKHGGWTFAFKSAGASGSGNRNTG